MMDSKSKWFVGSSISNRSGFRIKKISLENRKTNDSTFPTSLKLRKWIKFDDVVARKKKIDVKIPFFYQPLKIIKNSAADDDKLFLIQFSTLKVFIEQRDSAHRHDEALLFGVSSVWNNGTLFIVVLSSSPTVSAFLFFLKYRKD